MSELVGFVHLELLSQNGETGKKGVGSKPFVLILQPDYQTNGTQSIINVNLMHAAAVLNGTVVRDKVAFPYVALSADTGFGGVNREDSWLYVSQRLIPTRTEEIKTWLKKVATEFHANGLKIEERGTTATLWKGAWSATELAK